MLVDMDFVRKRITELRMLNGPGRRRKAVSGSGAVPTAAYRLPAGAFSVIISHKRAFCKSRALKGGFS